MMVMMEEFVEKINGIDWRISGKYQVGEIT